MSEKGTGANTTIVQIYWNSPYFARILTILVTLAILLQITHGFTPSVAKAYSCPNDFGLKHCYGLQNWPGGPINGSATTISVVALQCCPGYSDGVVDNEMWLIDCNPDSIFCSSPHWIETGYVAYATHVENYFWGDFRPGDTNVNYHPLNNVPPGDINRTAFFRINRTNSSTFDVYLSSTYVTSDNTSRNNSMTPYDIEIGQELGGEGGASAPRAYFTSNTWIDTSGVGHWQTSLGNLDYNNPPYVGWSTDPPHSSTGGKLWTNCC